MNKVSVLYAGDTHGEFDVLSGVIGELQPDAVISVGDFGCWKKSDLGVAGDGFIFDSLKSGRTKVYFCDGNHENHAILGALVEKHGADRPIAVAENLFYMPRGSTLELNGRRILFLGGAWSIDQEYRTEGVSWFPEEEFSEEDLARVLSNPEALEADTVVSHTCPLSAVPEVCRAGGLQTEWITHTVTEERLQRIAERLPKVRDWYFGHWHFPGEFRTEPEGIRFHLLNMMPLEKSLAGMRGSGFTKRRLAAALDRVLRRLDGEDQF